MKQNWEYKKLGEVVSFIGDGDWIESRHQSDNGIRLVQTGNIGNGVFKAKDDKPHFISELTFEELGCTEIFEGDCLVSRLPDPIGRACIIPNMKNRMITAVDCTILRFQKLIDSNFFVYYTRSKRYNKEIENYTTGSTRKRISRKNLESILIPVPSLSEQSRIVSELNLLTGIIDKQNAQLKELDNLAQSIFYDMFGDPIENPKGWDVKKLGDVCSVVNGLVDPNEEPYCNYPHIGGANIQSNTGVFVDVKLAKDEGLISGKYFFDESMILYSKIRPNLNKVALPSFKGICSADMYPLITNTDIANKYYIKFSITHKKFIEYAVSHSGRANIPKINREALLAYDLPLPPLTLQQSFAEKIQSIEKQKETIRASIADTQKLLDYTMDKYFG